MPSEPPSALLDRVRKLLAKAEAEGVTPPEAEALTAKAAELMARYGIDRARLAASRPETDRPGSRVIDIDNPWAQVRAHLLAGLAGAMRCQCVLLHTSGPGARIHVFGYASDLERADILYTSLLLQMARGLTAAVVPDGVRSVRAWRRSWLLGFVTAVITRVRSAEERAASQRRGRGAVRAEHGAGAGRPGRGHPAPAGRGVPGDPEDPHYLQRPRLQRRLRPGPAGRHRQRPPGPEPRAQPRLSELLLALQQREEDRVGAVAVRPELGEPGVGGAQAGDVGEDGGSVQDGDVAAEAGDGGDHIAGLGQVR